MRSILAPRRLFTGDNCAFLNSGKRDYKGICRIAIPSLINETWEASKDFSGMLLYRLIWSNEYLAVRCSPLVEFILNATHLMKHFIGSNNPPGLYLIL